MSHANIASSHNLRAPSTPLERMKEAAAAAAAAKALGHQSPSTTQYQGPLTEAALLLHVKLNSTT